jgi:hypothetical protein
LLAGVLYTQGPGNVYWVSAGMIGVMVVVSGIFAPREKSSREQTVIIEPPKG